MFALLGCGDICMVRLRPSLQPLRPGGVDWTVLGFTGGNGAADGVVVRSGTGVSRDGARTWCNRSRRVGTHGHWPAQRVRGWLVIFEVALSVVLLAGAGVSIKSFVRLSAVDPGFRPESVLTVRIQRQRYQEKFCSQVLERASAIHGVIAAGAASNLPMTGQDWGQNLTVEGRPFHGDQDYVWACHRVASLNYFRTMGMRLLKGRLIRRRRHAATGRGSW